VIWFLLLIVILLIGLTAFAVMGKIGGFMADPTSTQSFVGLPSGPLSSQDLAELHIDQALRGYRMDQVDEVIDALGTRLRELESEIASRPVSEDSPPTPGDERDERDERGDSGEPGDSGDSAEQ
jgi:proteasome assembly chaperone (PAC2) family protein